MSAPHRRPGGGATELSAPCVVPRWHTPPSRRPSPPSTASLSPPVAVSALAPRPPLESSPPTPSPEHSLHGPPGHSHSEAERRRPDASAWPRCAPGCANAPPSARRRGGKGWGVAGGGCVGHGGVGHLRLAIDTCAKWHCAPRLQPPRMLKNQRRQAGTVQTNPRAVMVEQARRHGRKVGVPRLRLAALAAGALGGEAVKATLGAHPIAWSPLVSLGRAVVTLPRRGQAGTPTPPARRLVRAPAPQAAGTLTRGCTAAAAPAYTRSGTRARPGTRAGSPAPARTGGGSPAGTGRRSPAAAREVVRLRRAPGGAAAYTDRGNRAAASSAAADGEAAAKTASTEVDTVPTVGIARTGCGTAPAPTTAPGSTADGISAAAPGSWAAAAAPSSASVPAAAGGTVVPGTRNSRRWLGSQPGTSGTPGAAEQCS
eukprot:scaffold9899_cov122-Isochrysis_galbana.AAC.2